MKLSTILVLTLCQFLVEAAIFQAGPSDLSMRENCAEQVRNVQVFEMVNQLVVTWLPPNCNIEGVQVTYILEYSSAGETLTIETRETFHYFDYTTNVCFDVELKITPSLDGILGVSYDTIYRASSSQVTHVQVFQMMTQLVVVWNPPECVIGDVQVKYIVTYTTTTETQTIETEQTFHYFDHNGNICSDVEIMIRAVIDGKTGVPYYAIYNTGLGEVANLYAEHMNTTVHVQWEAPVGGSDCDLDYLITLDTNKDSISITVDNKFEVDIENIYMQPCENGTVTITPMRGATVGSRLTRIVQGEIGPVRNIVIGNDDNEIFVDYDEPENTDLCNLRYSVHYRPADCFQREISIIAFNTFGNSRHVTSTTVDLDMQIPPVNNLVGSRDNNNVIDVTWDPVFPEYNCNVAYRISREFPDGRLNNITRTATSWSDMECRQMTYRVAPVVNDIPGLISKSVTVPASPDPDCMFEPTDSPWEEPWD